MTKHKMEASQVVFIKKVRTWMDGIGTFRIEFKCDNGLVTHSRDLINTLTILQIKREYDDTEREMLNELRDRWLKYEFPFKNR